MEQKGKKVNKPTIVVKVEKERDMTIKEISRTPSHHHQGKAAKRMQNNVAMILMSNLFAYKYMEGNPEAGDFSGAMYPLKGIIRIERTMRTKPKKPDSIIQKDVKDSVACDDHFMSSEVDEVFLHNARHAVVSAEDLPDVLAVLEHLDGADERLIDYRGRSARLADDHISSSCVTHYVLSFRRWMPRALASVRGRWYVYCTAGPPMRIG